MPPVALMLLDSLVTSELFQSSMPGGRKIAPTVKPPMTSHCAPKVKTRALSVPPARMVSRNCAGCPDEVWVPDTVLLLL